MSPAAMNDSLGAQPLNSTVLPGSDGHTSDPASLLDLSHMEAYTVIVLGLLQGAYLVTARPFSVKDAPNGCAHNDVRHSGGGCIPAVAMFAFRTAVALYGLGIHVYHTMSIGFRIHRFYTIWNWTLLWVYFSMAAHQSWRLLRSKPGSWPRLDSLGQATVVLFHICATNAMLIDTITWTALVPMLVKYNPNQEEAVHFSKIFFSFLSYNEHGVNLALMLVELFINNMQFYPHMLGYVQLLSCTFGCWANLYFFLAGQWLYPFLDTSRPTAWEAYLALFAAHWVFYGTLCVLHRAKGWVTTASLHQIPVAKKAQ
mmetsp:Transcript_12797/g.35942  ORF Transcript_12797/g.35942 Transcript_12797/m.35942 type:complete len:313 (-) Transcript_12797:400-1338(-)